MTSFGCVIVGDKFKAVEWIKYPIKYWILLVSGIISILLGRLFILLFPVVDQFSENLRDTLFYIFSFIDIWIGALGYLA